MLQDGAPEGWEVVDPKGRTSFYLIRQYRNEQIVVEVSLDSQLDPADGLDDDEDEGEDDSLEGSELPVTFEVSVIKGDSSLVFACQGNGEYVTINHLALETAGGPPAERPVGPPSGSAVAALQRLFGGRGEDDEDEEAMQGPADDAYSGPVFSELDDTLQQAFVDFLEERGITPDLSEYLRLYASDKQSLEYMDWLAKVRDFVVA